MDAVGHYGCLGHKFYISLYFRFTVGDVGFSEQKLQREPPPAETTMVVLHVTEVIMSACIIV